MIQGELLYYLTIIVVSSHENCLLIQEDYFDSRYKVLIGFSRVVLKCCWKKQLKCIDTLHFYFFSERSN